VPCGERGGNSTPECLLKTDWMPPNPVSLVSHFNIGNIKECYRATRHSWKALSDSIVSVEPVRVRRFIPAMRRRNKKSTAANASS